MHNQPNDSLKIGCDRLFTILAERRLLVPPRRAFHKTTHSFHRFYRHPNRLKPALSRSRRQRLSMCGWRIYLPARSGPMYLSLVTDAYSRNIVGHHVHESLHAKSVAVAFRQALRGRQSNQALIHYSDRRILYCSALYQALHKRHGVQCSMTDATTAIRTHLPSGSMES